jgi:hypothetical protein
MLAGGYTNEVLWKEISWCVYVGRLGVEEVLQLPVACRLALINQLVFWIEQEKRAVEKA